MKAKGKGRLGPASARPPGLLLFLLRPRVPPLVLPDRVRAGRGGGSSSRSGVEGGRRLGRPSPPAPTPLAWRPPPSTDAGSGNARSRPGSPSPWAARQTTHTSRCTAPSPVRAHRAAHLPSPAPICAGPVDDLAEPDTTSSDVKGLAARASPALSLAKPRSRVHAFGRNQYIPSKSFGKQESADATGLTP